LGPNGAGKTTTVEILEGVNEPDAGSVRVLGRTWSEDGRALRERIGIQLQETQLSEKLTVLETIELFRSFYAKGLEPQEVMRIVQLEEKEKAWVRKLSGGQKQRLSLAVALVGDPEILFLDEPTTGLDPQARRQVWDVIANVKARGGTVLLTTHYMEEAERLCDRVGIIDEGKIRAEGTRRELVGMIGERDRIELSATGNLAAAADAARAFDGVEEATVHEGGLGLIVVEAHRILPRLLEAVGEAGASVTSVEIVEPDLEAVFLHLTGKALRD
jgi:ABC-2 type transport system ATP-binding protein